ncbi:MAG: msfA [Solimicrobium sp.]|jgi:TPR repeat protein|nr:msfA [Solimicrobium sp.]
MDSLKPNYQAHFLTEISANNAQPENQRDKDFHRALVLKEQGDYRKAFDIFKTLAENGYPQAQYQLGLIYFYWEGLTNPLGKEWIRKAADNGNGAACLMTGTRLLDLINLKTTNLIAIHYLKQAAKQNIIEACYLLGECYFDGINIPQNDNEALIWYKKVVELIGNLTESKKYKKERVRIEHNIEIIKFRLLCDSFLTGVDTTTDESSLASSRSKSEDSSCSTEESSSTENSDTSEASSVELKDPGAPIQIKLLQQEILNEQQEKAQLKKVQQDKINAELAKNILLQQKNVEVRQEKLQLAFTNLEKQDYPTAFNQFILLAQGNDPEAQFHVGVMYMKGHGVQKSDTNAIRYLNEAFRNKHAKAAFMLGELYRTFSLYSKFRCFVKQEDVTDPVVWYKIASEMGDVDASYKIAELLIEAGNIEDTIEIRHYLALAIKQGHQKAEQTLSNWENRRSWNWSFNMFKGDPTTVGLKDEIEDEKL